MRNMEDWKWFKPIIECLAEYRKPVSGYAIGKEKRIPKKSLYETIEKLEDMGAILHYKNLYSPERISNIKKNDYVLGALGSLYYLSYRLEYVDKINIFRTEYDLVVKRFMVEYSKYYDVPIFSVWGHIHQTRVTDEQLDQLYEDLYVTADLMLEGFSPTVYVGSGRRVVPVDGPGHEYVAVHALHKEFNPLFDVSRLNHELLNQFSYKFLSDFPYLPVNPEIRAAILKSLNWRRDRLLYGLGVVDKKMREWVPELTG